MIASIVVTGGNAYDGKQFPHLVRKDQEQRVPMEIYSADRGYNDGANHYLLETLGLQSAIPLNRYQMEKKDRNRDVCIALKDSPAYRAGLKERYKAERKYGEAQDLPQAARMPLRGLPELCHPGLPDRGRAQDQRLFLSPILNIPGPRDWPFA